MASNRIAAAGTLLACLALLAPATSAKTPAPRAPSSRAGQLDFSFGRTGRVSIPVPNYQDGGFGVGRGLQPGHDMTIAPSGQIAIGTGRTIVELDDGGKPDPRFGRHGRLRIPIGDGLKYQLAAISFDSKGRLVVAGTTALVTPQSTPGPEGYPGPPRQWATIRRYLPNGKPDPSFGSIGAVETDFGLAAPESQPIYRNAGGTFIGPEIFHYATPSLLVTGLAIDSEDRPLVTGAVVKKVGQCYTGLHDFTAAYAARLSTAGGLDPSFGAGGTYVDSRAIQAQPPVIDRFGRLLYVGLDTEACGHGPEDESELVALGTDGQPELSFGTGGRIQLVPYTGGPILAVNRFGRILLFGRTGHLPGGGVEETLIRLAPSGALDANFGSGGGIEIDVPRRIDIATLGVDGRGRALLAGTRSSGPERPSQFLLRRITATGEEDRAFGRRGSVLTGFNRRAGAHATDVVVDPHGRIVASGRFYNARYYFGSGIAVARYLGGR